MASETTYAELSFKNESESSSSKSRPPAGDPALGYTSPSEGTSGGGSPASRPQLTTAPKEKSSRHKSNPNFPKLLFASLLVLLLLLAISFFIAFIIFFQKYSQLLKEKKTTIELTHTALECLRENVTMEGKDWSCCPKAWKSFRSHCYFISNTDRNWTESEKNCSAMKAHLLVISTKDEQDFIIQNVATFSAYYIGLSDPKGKRDWHWVDQTPYNESVTFWHPREPSNRKERCVALHFRDWLRKWGWNDVSCNEDHKSLCKMMKIYL